MEVKSDVSLQRMKFFATLVFVFQTFTILAWQVRGVVVDEARYPVAYASVYLENTTYGVATNIKGEFIMDLDNGVYNLVVQSVGYEKIVRQIEVKGANQFIEVTLPTNAQLLQTVEISSDREDPAYPIIRKAIAARKENNKAVDAFSCDVYSKVSLEKEYFVHDTLDRKARDTVENTLEKERMNFLETNSKLYFKAPDQWKEVKEAVRDLSVKKAIVGVFVNNYDPTMSYGQESVNRQMFKTNLSEASFNFYENQLDLPSLGDVPFPSPIGLGAFVNYEYRLDERFYENGFWVNKIEVSPKRKFSALFSGYIYITDSLWSIKAVDLEPQKTELIYFNYFRVFQEYDFVNDSIWLIAREEYFYETKDYKQTEIGNTTILYENYDLNPSFDKKFFSNEVTRTLDDAYEKDSIYWDSIRPISLKSEEKLFIQEQDSIDAYHASEEFMKKDDSTYNHIGFWDVTLQGIYHKNSFTKLNWNFLPLIAQINPLGIGGYRHSLGGAISKEFSKANVFSVRGEMNYGFLNQDLRGNVNTSYTYLPKKFARFHAEYRNDYMMLNQFTALATIFSRSNYVRDIFYSIGHEFEVFNGVYADATVEYGQKLPITGMKLSKLSEYIWSDEVLGDFNTPTDFNPYYQFSLDFRVKFTPFQKYRIEPYKKVVIPNDWPKMVLHYKKAIPGILNSTGNFDLLEARVFQNIQIGTWGVTRWQALAGSYLNDGNVLVADYKYFRRSDIGLFSNPITSFQLLRPEEPAIATTQPYFQVNYVHNFEGSLLNKVPLVRRAGLQLMGGAGMLLINEGNIRHAEAFTGLEWPFKLGKQRFKIGGYYVVGQSTLTNFSGEFKIGIDFFNEFTNSWTY